MADGSMKPSLIKVWPAQKTQNLRIRHKMALFGRESKGHAQRAEQWGVWIRSRSPFALLSAACGVLSIVDSILMVLSIPAAIAALILAWLGWRDIKRRSDKFGRRLCIVGASLGVVGLTLSLLMWPVLVPAIQNCLEL